MKILQVNCVYKKGSTGKIVYDIHTELLKKGIDSVVCYGRGERDLDAYKICSETYSKINHLFALFSGILYGGCHFATLRLIRKILKEKPDIVHLHCINGHFVNIYRLITWLSKNKISTVLTLHAEFMFTGTCGYAFECDKWKEESGCKLCPQWKSETNSLVGDKTHKAFRKMKKAFNSMPKDYLEVVSVSPWLENRAKESAILKKFNHSVVFNGIDTNVFKFYKENDILKNDGKFVVFHATPYFCDDINHIKGGYFLIELAKRLEHLPIHFFVAGRYDENIKVPKNVTLLGEVKDQEKLARYYSFADLTLLTSKRETFSMICAESLCCGTPILGFKAGAPETISMKEYSRFVDYGNLDSLQSGLETFIKTTFDKEKISSDAIQIYSKNRMMMEYLQIYTKLIDNRG